MLYHFLYSLKDQYSYLNIFRYITFRAVLAALSAFLISVIIGPFIIGRLSRLKIRQQVRKKEECPDLYKLHSAKSGTPTMGGILLLISILIPVFLWTDLSNKYVLLTALVTVWLAVLGFIDDYIKLTLKRSKGLGILGKLIPQVVIGLIIGWFIYNDPYLGTRLDVPFFKNVIIHLGQFYIIFAMLVIVGSSNATNLTDGLDGLAIGCTIPVALAFSIFSYVSGNAKISEYLLIPYLPGAGELTIFLSAIIGAGLGFLWFNCFPASIFMGDIGSLALGGAIGAAALFIKKELLLGLVGGVFVIEAVSVILQVGSFRLRKGKRIFKVAPIHHHFQLLGWDENKVIVRFWILGIIFAVLALMTLKMR